MEVVNAEVEITATTTDALNATQLSRVPGPGAIAVYMAATVADWLATVVIGNKVLKNNSLITKVDANRQINVLEDPSVAMQVTGGEKVQVDVTEVTAGTGRIMAIWTGVSR